jgi:methyl-accepting chemotaxis protein
MSDMANGATAQASETQTVSEAVMQIGDGIEQTTGAIQNLLNNADTMKRAGQAGVESVEDLESISEKVKSQIAVIYQQTNTTNESAQEIHKATELISSIANETNLLALNASIEAARAGESGRGFAVVAEQIKNLAEQSNQSAKTIEGIIKNLLEESEQAVKTMNTVDAIIGLQADKVDTTRRVFAEVNDGLQVTISDVESIASNTQMLEQAKAQVMSSVESLSAIAEQNAAATQETAASAEELAATISEIKDATSKLYSVSDELTGELNMFQIY